MNPQDIRRNSLTDQLLLLAFLLSGFAALGYELIWTRLLAFSLGSETLGMLGVVAGFFAGMVIGAFCFNEYLRKGADPGKLFAVLEFIVAFFSLISPHLLHYCSRFIPRVIGPFAGDNNSFTALLLSILISGLLLMPATICMGGTFAALTEAWRNAYSNQKLGKGLGRLYAANTFGATLGVLFTVYFIQPVFGLFWGSFLLSVCGCLAAVFVLIWRKRLPKGGDAERVASISVQPESVAARSSVYILLFAAGLAGLGLEVVAVQILSQTLENTVYTFANMLAVYLLGTSLGAWLFQRFLVRLNYKDSTVSCVLFSLLSFSVVIASLVLRYSPAALNTALQGEHSYFIHLGSEFILSFCVFFLPTVLMGILFSQLTSMVPHDSIGKAYGVNTLGAALAPFLFCLVFFKYFGYEYAFFAVLCVYAAIPILFSKTIMVRLGGLLCIVLWMFTPSLKNLIKLNPGWEVIARKDGLMGVVMALKAPASKQGKDEELYLQVNNHFRMGGGSSFSEKRAGHLPLLLVPNAKKIVYLGIGTGTTLSAVQQYGYSQIDAVEIVPEVLDIINVFSGLNENVKEDETIRFRASDARRFMAASSDKYDVIFADLYHPGRDGAGFLYSKDHFNVLREHLADRGIVAQLIPLYQFDVANLKSVVKSFLSVFPNVHGFMCIYNVEAPILMLVGANAEFNLDRFFIAEQLAPGKDANAYVDGITDFLASYFCDREALFAFAGDAPLNTDLYPYVVFNMPKATYEQTADMNFKALDALMPFRKKPLFSFSNVDDGVYHQASNRWDAVGLYLEGQIEYAIKGKITKGVLEKHVKAYLLDNRLAIYRNSLLTFMTQDPSAGNVIRRLLADGAGRKGH